MKSFTNSKIVILGGGTSGWVTGLFIKRNYPNVDISIIEDPKRPPIIAGESGSTTFTDFLTHLKIDKEDFVRKVNATPKLGGRFTDWGGVGTEFLHVMQTDFTPWLDDWNAYFDDDRPLTVGLANRFMMASQGRIKYLKTLLASGIPLEKVFLAGEYIRQNKVPFGAKSDLPCVPMWHFESRAAAAYFKNIGLERGINLIEGEYKSSNLNEQGNIVSILLDGDRVVDGDWFFDCSGFSRLLLSGVMQEKIIDYTQYFPARAVVAWWDKPCYCLTTNAIAMKYGWSWNINIRNRSGNGYLYDPDHISLDQAVAEAETRFNKKIEPIANFKFTPGIMQRAWRNNVIAVGLSSGFLEPLEANGVAVIVETLYALHDNWDPVRENTQRSVDRFNDRTFHITEDIKDFLALHYRGKRADSEFWLSHKNPDRIPDSLKEKLEIWKKFYTEDNFEPLFNGYSPVAWMMVLQGLEVFDSNLLKSPLQDKINIGQTILNNTKSRFEAIVSPFWTLEEWIQKTA